MPSDTATYSHFSQSRTLGSLFLLKVLILLGFWVYVHPSRGVAQPGSASALGAEGRRFESVHPDH